MSDKLPNISYRPPRIVEDFKRFGFSSKAEFLDAAVELFLTEHEPGLDICNKLLDHFGESIQQLENNRDYDEASFTDNQNQLHKVLDFCYQLILRTDIANHEINMINETSEETVKRNRWAIVQDKFADEVFKRIAGDGYG